MFESEFEEKQYELRREKLREIGALGVAQGLTPAEATYPNRFPMPASPQRTSWRNVRRGLSMLARILWKVGVLSDYRREFWAFAWPRLRRGEIEPVIQVGLVSRHLIRFAREAASGEMMSVSNTLQPRA